MPSSSNVEGAASVSTALAGSSPSVSTREVKAPPGRTSRWGRLPVALRRAIIVVGLVCLWQLYVSMAKVSPLVFSSPAQVGQSLWKGWTSGPLASATVTTLEILGISMLVGTALAAVLTTLARWTRFADDVLVLLSSMLNPLPSIAILPLAILWFGLTETSLILVIANAVVWPIAINVGMGFRTVNPTIVAVSRNIGLRGFKLVKDVLLPAALPHIVSGLKTGWAFGWRTVIAAELVFGVAGGKGGLGYFINQARYFLQIPDVFAGLVTIALIGIAFEWVFTLIERRTVVRWGMKTTAT
jgi:NitT/TauT family transport system permease protein